MSFFRGKKKQASKASPEPAVEPESGQDRHALLLKSGLAQAEVRRHEVVLPIGTLDDKSC